MELLSTTAQDDSSGANPSSVKSDDSSPRPEGGRGSPPPNCAICLGMCRNKSFTDSCLHQFCFKCLLTWSKVKAECPLCKQNFRSIIHNVRSNHQYEEYMVEQRVEEVAERIDIDALTTATRRFRYRTTLTLPRRESLAIQQLLLHYPLVAEALPPRAPPPARRRRSPTAFRRTVYRHNLWARPLPDFTGRFRDCRPDFYRYNDTQMHRLVPWLNRELHYLLNENVGHISYVLTRILELLPQYHITSPEFRENMHRYFGDRTEHFLHELYCFASTPYDMTGYDRNVQYTTDTRISTMVNEIISSSDSDSVDSDIVMVSSSYPADAPPAPGPSSSRLPAPVWETQNFTIQPPQTDNVIPIETISHSDTDDDSSEVMVVGYIKPPQDRTPEVVDLLGSDSDVIVQDNEPQELMAADTATQTSAPETSRVPMVKLSLKRHPTRAPASDSDNSYQPPPLRRRRQRSNGSASTRYTARTTPSGSPPAIADSPFTDPTFSDTLSITASPSTPSDTASETETFSSSGSYMRGVRKRKLERKACKRNTKKRRSSRYETISPGIEQLPPESNFDRKKYRKSKSGKGVKSSRKTAAAPRVSDHEGTPPLPPPQNQPLANEPLPPSTVNEPITDFNQPVAESNHNNIDYYQPSTSGEGTSRYRSSDDRRRSRKHRRLRSVVNVMYNRYNSDDSSPSGTSSGLSSLIGTRNDNRSSQGPPSLSSLDSSFNVNMPMARRVDQSDSDDDLPLNLSIQKSFTYL